MSSCNFCCSGKAASITIRSVFCRLRYPACNERALYCHLWPVPLYYIFPTYLARGGLSEKKVIEYKMCVFLQHFFETFLILRRTERDAIKMNIILLVKYPLFSSDFTETSILSTDFRKTLKYQISWKVVQLEPSCFMRTDSRTSRHDAANCRFSQFCELS